MEVHVDGQVYFQRYEKGKPIEQLKQIGTCRKNDTGTTVPFLPDDEIFEKIKYKYKLQETNKENCIQKNLKQPCEKPEQYDKLWEDYLKEGYNKLIEKF